MSPVTAPVCYRAPWHPQLDPDRNGRFYALAQKIKNCIFYLPISLVAASINPRKEYIASEFDQIQTPDGVTLGVSRQPAQNSLWNGHVVILFNPLGTNVSPWQDFYFADSLQGRGFGVARFNYRGLGTTWSPKDLVVDGESIYQYLTNHCKIPANNIHFYGQSLGGAIAAQVKALHPESEGKYIGDRTFRSLFHVITEFLCIASLGPIVKKVSSVFGLLLAYPLYWLGLDLDTEAALQTMRGEKKIFYLPEDAIVCGEASLHHVCDEKDAAPLINGSHYTDHFQPISRFQVSADENAARAAIDFLQKEIVHC